MDADRKAIDREAVGLHIAGDREAALEREVDAGGIVRADHRDDVADGRRIATLVEVAGRIVPGLRQVRRRHAPGRREDVVIAGTGHRQLVAAVGPRASRGDVVAHTVPQVQLHALDRCAAVGRHHGAGDHLGRLEHEVGHDGGAVGDHQSRAAIALRVVLLVPAARRVVPAFVDQGMVALVVVGRQVVGCRATRFGQVQLEVAGAVCTCAANRILGIVEQVDAHVAEITGYRCPAIRTRNGAEDSRAGVVEGDIGNPVSAADGDEGAFG